MDMSVEINHITSGDKLDDIEHHFKVSAGPGAGKTHWLVNHIKEVLHTSKRLDKSREVACITYTNTAVEIIRNRLGVSTNQVEISTIHSFLYKHIIKPYIHFIANEYNFNISRLDGHDDVQISKGATIKWLKEHSKKDCFKHPYSLDQLTKNPDGSSKVHNWLSSVSYKFDTNDNLYITADRKQSYVNGRPLAKKCLELLEVDLKNFKEMYWNQGILSHDDILFFSFEIIKNYPFVLSILRAKFPYFFVDEFQDSNPIQVKLLRMIGEQDTIVGIIGDKAQSIFSFQGAEPTQFEEFELEGMKSYRISCNMRSTKEIVDLLNYIRADFKQENRSGFIGNKPVIYIGDRLSVFKEVEANILNEQVTTLSWKNITANALKKDIEGIDLNDNLLNDLINIDRSDRPKLIIPCIKAVELCREKKIKEALKELKRCFKRDEDNKNSALNLLFLLNNRYDEYCDQPLMTLYNILRGDLGMGDLNKFKPGKPKDFYDNNNYRDISLCVNIIEDTSSNITIHKSKGSEFDSVLLVLDKESDLDFITAPNLDNEKHRLQYVAISRAIKNLYINVPELSQQTIDNIETLGLVNITHIN